MPNLTVIVCTHNRAVFLDDCLAALAAQDADRACFDVIVVDNGSTDGTKSIVEKHAAASTALISYIYEAKLGLERFIA